MSWLDNLEFSSSSDESDVGAFDISALEDCLKKKRALLLIDKQEDIKRPVNINDKQINLNEKGGVKNGLLKQLKKYGDGSLNDIFINREQENNSDMLNDELKEEDIKNESESVDLNKNITADEKTSLNNEELKPTDLIKGSIIAQLAILEELAIYLVDNNLVECTISPLGEKDGLLVSLVNENNSILQLLKGFAVDGISNIILLAKTLEKVLQSALKNNLTDEKNTDMENFESLLTLFILELPIFKHKNIVFPESWIKKLVHEYPSPFDLSTRLRDILSKPSPVYNCLHKKSTSLSKSDFINEKINQLKLNIKNRSVSRANFCLVLYGVLSNILPPGFVRLACPIITQNCSITDQFNIFDNIFLEVFNCHKPISHIKKKSQIDLDIELSRNSLKNYTNKNDNDKENKNETAFVNEHIICKLCEQRECLEEIDNYSGVWIGILAPWESNNYKWNLDKPRTISNESLIIAINETGIFDVTPRYSENIRKARKSRGHIANKTFQLMKYHDDTPENIACINNCKTIELNNHPMSIAAVNEHPYYFSKLHLGERSIIKTDARPAIMLKGKVYIYKDDAVSPLLSEFQWLIKYGKKIKRNQTPVKMVKSTLHDSLKQAALNAVDPENNQIIALYSIWQTEDVIFPPISSTLPTRFDGSLELFANTKLPSGVIQMRILTEPEFGSSTLLKLAMENNLHCSKILVNIKRSFQTGTVGPSLINKSIFNGVAIKVEDVEKLKNAYINSFHEIQQNNISEIKKRVSTLWYILVVNIATKLTVDRVFNNN